MVLVSVKDFQKSFKLGLNIQIRHFNALPSKSSKILDSNNFGLVKADVTRCTSKLRMVYGRFSPGKKRPNSSTLADGEKQGVGCTLKINSLVTLIKKKTHDFKMGGHIFLL